MASLPTAYASQRFGRKSLDFYAAAGDVIGADPRARADERRLQDLEGARHTVRLMESGFRLEPGDQASVLRMQPGPARRSRPVAVVNHTHGAWSRTHPGASGLLARAGVARTWNWALTVLLFIVAGLTVVWPYLRAFLVEIDPGLFGSAPQFDVFALAAGAAPALAEWRIADLTAGLSAQLAQLAPTLGDYTAHAAFGAVVLLGAVVVHALRSWRLIWAPMFVTAIGAGAMGFDGAAGAATPALIGLGVASGLFVIAGAFNKIRDAARLERRIAVLADHILRNPAEEMVTGPEETSDADVEAEQGAGPEIQDSSAAPLAAASAYRSTDDADGAETVEAGAEDQAPPEDVESPAAPSAEADDGAEAVSEAVDEAVVTDDAEEPSSDAQAEAGRSEETTASASPDEAHPAAQQDGEDRTPTATRPAEGGAEEAALEAEPEPQEAQSPSETTTDGSGETGEAEGSGADEPSASTFEQEEIERLRTDPRYASRAIVLPPPPPMPAAAEEETVNSASETSRTRTLQPDAPLPSNVVPMFAAPAPSQKDTESVD